MAETRTRVFTTRPGSLFGSAPFNDLSETARSLSTKENKVTFLAERPEVTQVNMV